MFAYSSYTSSYYIAKRQITTNIKWQWWDKNIAQWTRVYFVLNTI